MNDRSAPNEAASPTPSSAAEWLRLYEEIGGWIDADLLLPAEGEALQEVLTAVGQALDTGDETAVRRHLARFVGMLEALTRSRDLDMSEGHAALGTAWRMLEALAD
jgi:hypothetical protein